jgi:hypothetical protein
MGSKPGNEFHTIPAAEVAKFAAAGKAARERWVAEMGKKGLNGAAMLKEAEDLVAKYTN